jgi:hypothetical protein
MIIVLAPEASKPAADLVTAALRRSTTHSQVAQVSSEIPQEQGCEVVVVINPDKEINDYLLRAVARGNKIKVIIFGSLTNELMHIIGVAPREWPDRLLESACSDEALPGQYAESKAKISYTELASQLQGKSWNRPLERFDFADEWNNMGYGAVRADHSDWSISLPVQANLSCSIAEVESDAFTGLAYAAIKDLDHLSILWFNRTNGPIDSFEWQVIEDFLSSWRSSDLPCVPIIKEIPYGYDCCVTMRLDCDEDIESARELRAEYLRLEVPFSLAIHTQILQNISQHQLIKEMVERGESILSHSATHASNWGGSYKAAMDEARYSAEALKDITGILPKYAVSPFHQTPDYALQALADCGYSGCIGGIISSNPEFNLARGGELAGLPPRFIGHSQQHMLHGDCMLQGSDPLAMSKRAFMLARETNTLFGYLDHPFSERYSYGWLDETSRISAHRDLIRFIKDSVERPLFLSEVAALDFLLYKSGILITDQEQAYIVQMDHASNLTDYDLTIEYRGETFKAINGLCLTKFNSCL